MNVKQLSGAIVEWARLGEDISGICRRADELFDEDPELALAVARRWVFSKATDAVTEVAKPAGISSRAPARRGQMVLGLTLLPAAEAVMLHWRRIRSRTKVVARQEVDMKVWAFVESWRSVHDDADIPDVPYGVFLAQIGVPVELVEALAA